MTDANNLDRTDHLLALNEGGYSGQLDLHTANLLEQGSYDEVFAGCSAVLHVGTVMGYGGVNGPRQVYDGAMDGTLNILDSVKKAGAIKRVIYPSSFGAIYHPARPGYVYTEKDWAPDNREDDPGWSRDRIDEDGDMAYTMAKVEAEHRVNRIAEEDGRFDVISVCPIAVLGPLASKAHELLGSWQWHLGQMLVGRPCQRAWKSLWNVVDVRDLGESQALMIEKCGKVYDAPRAHCDKARGEPGLQTYLIEDTLFDEERKACSRQADFVVTLS